MKSTTARRITLSVVAVTTLGAVVACSPGDSSGSPKASGKDDGAAGRGVVHVSPVAALRSADTSTAEAHSARVSMTTSIGTLMSMKGNGTLDWADGLTGRLTLTYTGGTVAEAMRQIGATTMEARYLPDAYYAHMPDAYAEQTGGKHWIRYRYDDLANLAGGSGAYMQEQLKTATPNQSVKLLLASGDVRKVGEATVRGEHTTHYAGTLNVADFADRTSNLPKRQMDDLKKQLDEAGVTTESVDIWVNDKNLLVKKVEKADMATGTMTNTAYYSDYGVKTAVQAPPAGDTGDFKDLMASQGAAAAGGSGSGT
ncbi:hypothetical protein ACIHCX_24780 [Streptomyces sp. NPDC052043]|uniref:hypothetical protein n=1 Tax=Streptomyces sp. NPDC052043 TaxID=3365684 RepID=UPI0037D37D0E